MGIHTQSRVGGRGWRPEELGPQEPGRGKGHEHQRDSVRPEGVSGHRWSPQAPGGR